MASQCASQKVNHLTSSHTQTGFAWAKLGSSEADMIPPSTAAQAKRRRPETKLWAKMFWYWEVYVQSQPNLTSQCTPQDSRTPKQGKLACQGHVTVCHGLSRWFPTMSAFLIGKWHIVTVCHGLSRYPDFHSWAIFCQMISQNSTFACVRKNRWQHYNNENILWGGTVEWNCRSDARFPNIKVKSSQHNVEWRTGML